MPIIRKVLEIGDSKGITLPKSWLQYAEKENGSEILEVAIEVDRVLTISPIFLKPSTESKTEVQEAKANE